MTTEKTKFIYWHSGDPLPSALPEGCEYYHHVAWVEAFDIPSNHPTEWISEPRRWPCTEAEEKAHHWCLAHGVQMPDGYEVVRIDTDSIAEGEIHLCLDGKIKFFPHGHEKFIPHPILRKKEQLIKWVTPTNADVIKFGRLKCQYRWNDYEEWNNGILAIVDELCTDQDESRYCILTGECCKWSYECRVDARLLKGEDE